MEITGVRLVVHLRPSPFGADAPPPLGGTQRVGVLSIDTDEGISGQTLVSGPGATAALAQIASARPLLLGRDPLRVGAIWDELRRRQRMLGLSLEAIGWIDIALWDLSGRAAGRPIHALLGTYRDELPAYISSWVHARPEDYADEAAHYRQEGWPAYKLHPLTQRRMFFGDAVPVSADIKTCRLVREAVGDEMVLMLDSAWAYDYGEAVTVGRAIEELDYHWYEDPLPADDVPGYVRLKQQLHIPLLATEISGGGLSGMREWAVSGATDALRGDPIVKGGITPLMKIAHLAEAFGLPCEVHESYNATGNAAALNVAAAIPNCSWFEILTPQRTGEYGIHHFSYGLTEPLDIERGVAKAPTRPGLGYDIDWELIDSARDGEL
jgi:L-alanine-DL-glutamate epimerase-like enolase superfamily enzyme